MSDLAMGRGGRAAARYPAVHNTAPDDWDSPATGRHAFDEDAVLTPIFHSLSRGGWRSRQHDPSTGARQAAFDRPAFDRDPVDEFRRDPLTAPIPIQVLVPAPTRSRRDAGAHARSGPERAEQGRHHRRRREYVGSDR